MAFALSDEPAWAALSPPRLVALPCAGKRAGRLTAQPATTGTQATRTPSLRVNRETQPGTGGCGEEPGRAAAGCWGGRRWRPPWCPTPPSTPHARASGGPAAVLRTHEIRAGCGSRPWTSAAPYAQWAGLSSHHARGWAQCMEQVLARGATRRSPSRVMPAALQHVRRPRQYHRMTTRCGDQCPCCHFHARSLVTHRGSGQCRSHSRLALGCGVVAHRSSLARQQWG